MRNIIFDMGGVLLRFDPEHFLAREALSDADRALLMAAVFRAPEWPMLDSGALDEADMEPIALSKLPERLHAVAHRLIFDWEEPIEPIPGMAELVAECKNRGYSVYLLSNASRRQPEYWPKIPGSEHFDGGVVSAFERQVKPNPEIYHTLLNRFHLSPADCLFIDDMQRNVDAAIAVGMCAVRFTGDVQAIRKAIFEP
ncbi:MAG: HAD family hydrolase [bacterium]